MNSLAGVQSLELEIVAPEQPSTEGLKLAGLTLALEWVYRFKRYRVGGPNVVWVILLIWEWNALTVYCQRRRLLIEPAHHED
jgi:hypothetical protein